MEEKNYAELKAFVKKEGISIFGVCKIERLLSFIHPSIREISRCLKYGISIGYRLSELVLSTIEKVPTLIYKHHYKTVTWILDQAAEKLANFITSKGFRSFAIPSSQIVDWEHYTGHLSHILIAKESGLGWIGRSGLLVNPKYGAKVRYAAVLTDFPLSVDKPITNMGCGECRECIKACPCGAITETKYIKDKCLTQLKEFASIRGIGISICGVCVKVCNGGKYGA